MGRMLIAILQRVYETLELITHRDYKIKVLMFHNISENVSDEYTIAPREFQKLIVSIKNFTTIDGNKNNKGIVLTFDDAFDCVYEFVRPILIKRKIPYYIFICNEFIDKPGYLDRKKIEELSKDENCIIGSHLYEHKIARDLTDQELKNLMLKSKRELENICKRKINYFAFPYGSMYACGKREFEIALSIFEYVFTTIRIPYDADRSGNIVPRINVNERNWKKVVDHG